MPEIPNRVGKHLLESITTGMYDNSLCIFREYIQNATDALDEAISKGLVTKDSARIDVHVSPEKRKITIEDNGMGLASEKAFIALKNIGDSGKVFGKEAGFRGIGRLGGVSYCDKLSFSTSFFSEEVKSIVTWDCKKIRSLIKPGLYKEYDLFRVLDECVSFRKEPENGDAHYFKVELENIDEFFEKTLLDTLTVMEYIQEVAPLPYNSQKFIYDKYIIEYLENKGYYLETYNVYFNNSLIPLYKPYKTHFRANNAEDHIYDITYRDLIDENGKVLGVLWYAVTSWLGTIENEDATIRGIRLRKKNILIGDGSSLSKVFFTQERFNGWFIGEVFVFANLIPNARRDFFEQEDPQYPFFEKALKKHTIDELSKIPGKFSRARNTAKNIEKIAQGLEEIKEEIDNGITSFARKQELISQLEEKESTLRRNILEAEKINKAENTKDNGIKDHTIPNVAEKVITEAKETVSILSSLKEEIANNTKSISTTLNASYSRDEKKMFEKIIRILENQCGKCISLAPLKQSIVDELNKKCNGGKKK